VDARVDVGNISLLFGFLVFGNLTQYCMACFQFYYLQATQDWAGRCFSQLVALTANYFVFGKQFKDYKKNGCG